MKDSNSIFSIWRWQLCISLTLLTLIHAIMTANLNQHNYALFFAHFHKLYSTDSISRLSHIDSESDLHWLFIYSVLLMSLWDSLFAFFRYYSTAFIATLVYFHYHFALRLQSLLHLEILSFAHRIVQTKQRVAAA